jgi:hypothetical protein
MFILNLLVVPWPKFLQTHGKTFDQTARPKEITLDLYAFAGESDIRLLD